MKKQDGIYWRMPTAMFVCFVIGVGLAIGHHFYYYSLDGTRVGGQSKQEWALRFGTGLAFLTKTFLTTAVGIACIQNFWWILRLKPVRLSTLDSMFDIRGSIFNFFDLHIWLRGPNVAVLGLISWLIPLVTVITPSTLSVEPAIESTVSQWPIPTLDYDFYKYTMRSEGGIDGPTEGLARQVLNAVVHGSILEIPAPAPNASYTLDFIGPHIQCQNASDFVNNTVNEYLIGRAKLRTNYIAIVAGANITYDLISLGNSTRWLWHWHDVNETDYAAKLIMATYGDAPPLRKVIECGMYNASYTVNFSWISGKQSVQVIDRQVLNRVPPKTEMSVPPIPANEDEMFSYTAIMSVLNTILVGSCFSFPGFCSGTKVLSTALANSKELWGMVYGGGEPPIDLQPIEQVAAELAENITLSFFSNSYFLQNTTQAKSVNVTVHESQTNYLYSQKNLLIGYGVSVFVSLLCIISGLLTMWDNGVAFTDSFSSILRATRSKKFDEIIPHDSMTGADPSPESLSKTRVQWIPAAAREDSVAGLKPLPGVAESEKGENKTPASPISFSNGVQERKNYQPTVSHIDTSGNGFI